MTVDAIAVAAGRNVGHRRRGSGEHELIHFARQLLAAVLCQAVEDALRGDAEAALFLEQEGPGILTTLGLPGECIERWREVDVRRLRHTIGLGYEERKRLYVERRRRRRGAEARRGRGAAERTQTS